MDTQRELCLLSFTRVQFFWRNNHENIIRKLQNNIDYQDLIKNVEAQIYFGRFFFIKVVET